eukprot:4115494-Pleurochrysis_carterae.AAC.1
MLACEQAVKRSLTSAHASRAIESKRYARVTKRGREVMPERARDRAYCRTTVRARVRVRVRACACVRACVRAGKRACPSVCQSLHPAATHA